MLPLNKTVWLDLNVLSLSPAGLPLVTGYSAYDAHHSGTKLSGPGGVVGPFEDKTRRTCVGSRRPLDEHDLGLEVGHPIPPFHCLVWE